MQGFPLWRQLDRNTAIALRFLWCDMGEALVRHLSYAEQRSCCNVTVVHVTVLAHSKHSIELVESTGDMKFSGAHFE